MNFDDNSFTVKHYRIEHPESPRWNLIQFLYIGGTKIQRISKNWHKDLKHLVFIESRVPAIQSFKNLALELLNTGVPEATVLNHFDRLSDFFKYVDSEEKDISNPQEITRTLYDYAEFQLKRVNLKEIKPKTAYNYIVGLAKFMTASIDGVEFDIKYTRIKKRDSSQRAISREAEKALLSDASKLARLCFEITKNFNPKKLTLGELPIFVKVSKDISLTPINLTPPTQKFKAINKDYMVTQASQAFNYRVSAELMIFLAMTVQNIQPTLSLLRCKFDYKPIGNNYEIREYKHRRGGEVLFTIPKPYKNHFENYLKFLEIYAEESIFLFPYLKKGKGLGKRIDKDINPLRQRCYFYKIPWIAPKQFRKIGLNVLMRLCADEKTSAEYANHGVAVFRHSYEFPSLQKAMIEVTRFWEKNDPLTHGKPTVSLFNTPCNGMPEPIEDATNKLPRPDCISPTGCIGCKHYRDEESFDYVWNLHSFKYLKIIESSSHQTRELKPSNVAIDWANLKINWFRSSDDLKHKKWVEESEMRIDEGDYHPSWSRKIEKYEG